MNKNEKLKIYEQFFHTINLCCVIMNGKKITEAVSIIDAWSYAHRQGNGELSEKETKKLIEAQILKMKNFTASK